MRHLRGAEGDGLALPEACHRQPGMGAEILGIQAPEQDVDLSPCQRIQEQSGEEAEIARPVDQEEDAAGPAGWCRRLSRSRQSAAGARIMMGAAVRGGGSHLSFERVPKCRRARLGRALHRCLCSSKLSGFELWRGLDV